MVDDIGPVHHTGLTVRNLDRSVAFYRDVLGCSLIMEQEKTGGYLAEIVGYKHASVRMAHLFDSSSHAIIELFEYRSPEMLESSLEPARIGNAHMCFVVADLESIYERLVERGVETISPPISIDTGVNTGGKGMYLRDPDGITLELMQPARGTAAEALLRTAERGK